MQLLCGAAERVTTPKLGLDIPGYFGARKATGVKSDLYTQALVLDDGNEVLVLISIDILDFISPFSRAVRKRLFEQIGVSPDHVMLLATHAHTAQPTNYTGFAVKKNTAAMKRLEDLTVEAAVEAYQNRRAVRMFAGKGEVQGISFVRNYWLKDGKGILRGAWRRSTKRSPCCVLKRKTAIRWRISSILPAIPTWSAEVNTALIIPARCAAWSRRITGRRAWCCL